MDETAGDRVPFDDEQYNRAQALHVAGKVLRGSPKFATSEPGLASDIVDLAEYVISGIPFSVKAAALHDALHSRVGFVEVDPDDLPDGMLNDLLGPIFENLREQTPEPPAQTPN